ncbi:MAG: carbohydrate kinase family protein [Candidatus Saganbacteria bacterium]|nr:carbohydrate kinase family protein [Candidatus Saganbacteria bacterium]
MNISSIKAKPFSRADLSKSFIPQAFIKGRGGSFCGTTVVDQLLPVSGAPGEDKLVIATGERVMSTGGLVCNDAIAMRKLMPIPVQAVGLLGALDDGRIDGEGAWARAELQKHGIDVTGLVPMKSRSTSFTWIPTNDKTGKRGFIHNAGACSVFDGSTFPFDKTWDQSIAFIGYMNLLPALYANEGRGAAELFQEIHRRKGSLIGVDFTDIYDNEFKDVFAASARNVDFMIINETSLAKATDIDFSAPGDDVDGDKLLSAAQTVIEQNPTLNWLAIHWPKGGLFYRNDHLAVAFPAYQRDQKEIAGTTGAGDNWAAGFLAAAYYGNGPLYALALGTAAASKSLEHISATGASGSFQELHSLMKKCGHKPLAAGLAQFALPDSELTWNMP